ncbi:MAG TPA: hypothetical protein VN949_00700 [Candidatus Limnocylindrales bacterium]|nr:hypothetical protein [Candidatus Limnocylindrales bacterium]
MKLVTVWRKRSILPPEYVPGRCNIGRRGRAIRLTTGLVLIAISIVIGITFVKPVSHLLSLALVVPFYVGVLAILEGSMSFCVLHAARGTYDLNEPHGFASKKSDTLQKVGTEDWKKLDQKRALRMHLEALTGAVLLALLLALT